MVKSKTLFGLAVISGLTFAAPAAHADKVLYSSPELTNSEAQPKTLNEVISDRLKDNNLTRFRTALQNSELPADFDPKKGYTVFAVVDNAYDDDDAAPASYILNDRVGVKLMHGTLERHEALSGETLRLNRNGNSYYANDKLINDEYHFPEGVVYVVGGHKEWLKRPVVR